MDWLEFMDGRFVISGIIGFAIAGTLFYFVIQGLTNRVLTALQPEPNTDLRMPSWIEKQLPNRLDDTVRDLRDLGFFANRADVDDRTLSSMVHLAITESLERRSFNSVIPGRASGWVDLAQRYSIGLLKQPERDLLTLAEDRERVWWQDLDQVQPGQRPYARMIESWAAISRGAFQPTDVQESWGAEGESIYVTFKHAGSEQLFIHLTSHDTMLDTAGVRAVINPLIAATGVQFEIVGLRGTPDTIIALTAREREQLELRNWSFAEPPVLVL